MVARRNTVEIEGAALGTELARVAGVLSHPEGIMDCIGRYLVASTLRRFESERAPDGTPWLKSARAVAEGNRTLTDSGPAASLDRAHGHGRWARGRGGVERRLRRHPPIRRSRRQGRRARIPARPYLGIDERDRDAIARIVSRVLERAGP